MSITEKLLSHVKQAEGFREKPYVCPAGKLTIGYGFNIEDRGIPEEVAEFWLDYELGRIAVELPNLEVQARLDDPRYCVLIDMCFNLGLPRLLKFKKMFAALEEQDYDKAADEMLDSKWARQVGRRATFLAEVMRTGVWP